MHRSFYDRKIRRVRDLSCGDVRVYLDVEIRRVFCMECRKVKQERLDWLAGNPFYTKRFAFYVGRKCRAMTIQDVAKDVHLNWHTVKELEKQYMSEQLRKSGTAAPTVIGIDEVSIRKGHTYRIVVSDLIRRRPIWFGGVDRSAESMGLFYEGLGPKKAKKIRLVVMDMWKAFEKSAKGNIPQSAIFYDKFHVIRHLGEALDKIRKQEYARLSGKDRSFIKGQKHTLLSRKENLDLSGRQSLQKLLSANKRLLVAYLNSQEFIDVLQQITGIGELHCDSQLRGGGIHAIGRGGARSSSKCNILYGRMLHEKTIQTPHVG